MFQKEGNGGINRRVLTRKYPKLFITKFKAWGQEKLTVKIAGSSGTPRGGGSTVLAESSTFKSFTSEPRKTIYSNTLSEGGTSFSPRRPSVPNDRTLVSFLLVS